MPSEPIQLYQGELTQWFKLVLHPVNQYSHVKVNSPNGKKAGVYIKVNSPSGKKAGVYIKVNSPNSK